MRLGTIIQARMGSRRLPGKVLMDLGGRTMLARIVNRIRRAGSGGTILIATTSSTEDDIVAQEALALETDVFRGDPEDVLNRYHEAASQFRLDVIVRITADCPLADPEILDNVVRAFCDASPRPDFASNTIQRTYPRGLDVEVTSFRTLDLIWREAVEPHQRAHVFPFVHDHPERFRRASVTHNRDLSSMRWTVDTPEDLEFVRAVYVNFANSDDFSWKDTLELLERNPRLLEINRHVTQKSPGEL